MENQRKYKLIKEYPDSPELGTEITSRQHPDYMNNLLWSDGKVSYYNLRTENIINYPEFWKEVIEKEYEILSFKDELSDSIITCRTDGYYCYEDEYVLSKENFDKRNTWINSVKRLSDGEVFTIGDNTKEGKIVKFEICKVQDRDYLVVHTPVLNLGTSNIGINQVVKSKQKLFTTEDGVDIFDGDTYYYTNEHLKNNIEENFARSRFVYPNNSIRFSSKSKAEDYINLIKIKYSKKDLIDILDKCTTKRQITEFLNKN